jgi:hypothetical protein
LAAAPQLFGLQQLCEARVWDALGRGDEELARWPSLAFLFFALAVWPVWIPAAAAAIESPGRKRRAFAALAGVGVLLGLTYKLPLALGDGVRPAVAGHSLRYDFSAVALARSDGWWVGPALYLAVSCGPLLASRDRRLRPLGVAFLVSAGVTYALFESPFASVWCFFAAALSLYLAYALHRLPDPHRPPVRESTPGGPRP